VAVGEVEALSSELVDVGRGNLGGAVHADVTEADIVAVDDDDVGAVGGGGEGSGEQEGEEGEEEFHLVELLDVGFGGGLGFSISWMLRCVASGRHDGTFVLGFGDVVGCSFLTTDHRSPITDY